MSPTNRICSCGAQNAESAAICARCGADLKAPGRVRSGAEVAGAPDARAQAPTSAQERLHDRSEGGQVVAVADRAPEDAPTRPHPITYGTGSVLGSYRLVKQIGEGGMGRVFVAEHTRLGRKVALKILRPEYSGLQEAVRRFFEEARTVNRIKHENIIDINDFIEGDPGPSFYIMELLEGMDLRALQASTHALVLPRALRIAIQMASGLGAAHEAGVIHRDLKPENIFLVERQGRKDLVKLLDFGVAKLLNAKLDEASSFKSVEGLVVGTPEYMAPEQALGEEVDHRADIYSFGVILFEMIAGRPPFKAESAREHMAKHIMAPPPRLTRLRAQDREVPAALEDLILSCLEKQAEARPQSMKDVERRLRQIRESLPDSEDPADPVPAWSRRRWIGRAAILGAVLLASVGLVALTRGRHSKEALGHPRAADRSARAGDGRAVVEAARPKLVPVAPARVRIDFASTPPGATVFRVGSAEPMGVTPFSAAFEASGDAALFEFRLDGWRIERTSVPLVADAEVKLALGPAEPPAAPAASKHRRRSRERGPAQPEPPSKPVKLDHDIVLNPFE